MLQGLWNRLKGQPDAVAPSAEASAPSSPEPRPAVAPAEAAAPREATDVSLRRSLRWRSKVLMDGATPEDMKQDGPAVVASLSGGDEAVIRQLPAAAAEALRVVRDPNATMVELARLFENDPTLAPALLKQANSSWYRREAPPVVSLSEAVQRIGTQGVENVLTQALVHGLLCRPGGAYDALVHRVWSHMQRTAPIARFIAPAFGVHPENGFALALLHDVGKLVVFDHISTLRRERRRDLVMSDTFFRNLLWHVHEPLGGLAVLRWGMGGEAAHVVGDHHRKSEPRLADPLTELVYVAEAIDLAQDNGARLDWEAVWRDGGISADRGAVEARWAKLEG